MRRSRNKLTSFAFAAVVAALALGAFHSGSSAAQDPQGMVLQGDPISRAAEREQLFAALAAAQSAADAEAIVDQIWHFWFRPPNADAGKLMADAMERRSAYDYAGAIAILDQLVALAPDWAEAWNQRATMRFLADDLDGSLADCERVLELEPKHFGALSGQAIILMRQGRFDTAQSILRKAVEIDPFLAERALLVEPQKEEGKDI